MRKYIAEMLGDAFAPTFLDYGFRNKQDHDLFVERGKAVLRWIGQRHEDGDVHMSIAAFANIQNYFNRYLYPHHGQHAFVDKVLEAIQLAITKRLNILTKKERREFAELVIKNALSR